VLAALPRITSRRHPLVQACREARAGGPDHLLLLDGWHLVQEAVAAGLAVDAVAVGTEPRERADADALSALAEAGAQVVAVTADVLHAMSPVQTSSGIVALARRPGWTLDATVVPAPALALAVIDVQDPGNVGALVRTAEALGATGVIAAGASADPFGWKALRASMGSAFRLPLVRTEDPRDAMGAVRARGGRVLALVPRGGKPAADLDLTGDTCLLLGSEGAGLPPDLAAMADVRLSLPMAAAVESLNVTVAGALALYEAAQQRRARQ
jgi:TrmH family RNA methyltransferase